VEQDFSKNQYTRHSIELLGAAKGSLKLPKHYHVVQ
jgi:hypothetical protein